MHICVLGGKQRAPFLKVVNTYRDSDIRYNAVADLEVLYIFTLLDNLANRLVTRNELRQV